ncbi:MAG TPA: tyrosine-type recombinase/integrase [Acidimicrobiales bacterium]|nr:tyrosine-type recombinase/integrase [Acidimicrobiales bacterium]
MVWFILETGARRGALVGLAIGDLLWSARRVRLHEKKNKVDEQPISEALLAALLAMAVTRGDVIAKNPEGLAPGEITLEDVRRRRVTLRADRPVLYYRTPRRARATDGTVSASPHPLTPRRFNSLWDRLKRELAWLEEIHGRPHDLRKTVGTLVERELGYSVAQAVLRHAPGNVTGTYVTAGSEEKVRAHAWLTGASDAPRESLEW